MILGVDLSTKAIDLVYLNPETLDARWNRIPLQKLAKDANREQRLQSSRDMRDLMPTRLHLEHHGVYLLAIEAPTGTHNIRTTQQLHIIFGAVLATLGKHLPLLTFTPDEWRGELNLPKRRPKDAGRNWLKHRSVAWAIEHGAQSDWDDNACEALAVAHAAMNVNARALEEAA